MYVSNEIFPINRCSIHYIFFNNLYFITCVITSEMIAINYCTSLLCSDAYIVYKYRRLVCVHCTKVSEWKEWNVKKKIEINNNKEEKKIHITNLWHELRPELFFNIDRKCRLREKECARNRLNEHGHYLFGRCRRTPKCDFSFCSVFIFRMHWLTMVTIFFYRFKELVSPNFVCCVKI